MIGAIFIFSIVVYFSLMLSFYMKDATIGIISAFAIMVIGVYVLIYGMEGINDILTLAYGCISIGIGAYVSIAGTIQQIEEVM